MIDFAPPDELELLRETARRLRRAAAARRRPRRRGRARAVRRPRAQRLPRDRSRRASSCPRASAAPGSARSRARSCSRSSRPPTRAPRSRLDPARPGALRRSPSCGGEAALRELALPLLERPGARAVLAVDLDGRVARADGRARAARSPGCRPSASTCWCVLDREGRRRRPRGHRVRGAARRGAARRGRRRACASQRAARARLVGEPARRAARALARARLYVGGAAASA